MGRILLAIGLLMVALIIGVHVACMISFDAGCGSYLKTAADSNTIPTAIEELETAVEYIEANNLTDGSTQLIYYTRDCDLEFWHRNLSESLEELRNFPEDASNLEVSNQLIKLRETLIDHGQTGDSVTVPCNTYLYPNQVAVHVLTWLAAIFTFIGSIWTLVELKP